MSSLFSIGAEWLWSNYGKELADKAFFTMKKKWREYHWREAETKYRDRLRELYSTTRLLGHPKPINIENIFTDVYILDRLTAFWRYSLEDLEREVFEQESTVAKRQRIPALRLITESQRLFILGKPGAGKTTLLKYLTLQACSNKLHRTPIFVSMKDWADSELEIIQYLVQQFDICAFPDAKSFIEHLLEKGEAIVLFDGLDEVNQEGEKRKNVIREVIRFANRYSSVQVCITCRIAATDYSFDQFAYVEIADFDDKQIQSFVSKWYQDLPSKFSSFMKEFSRPENRGLRQLARTPLLLALLCLAFDETMAFPSRRVEVYREALDALLKKWDSSRGIRRDEIYRDLSPIRREQLLAWLAANNFMSGTYLFRQEALSSQISKYLKQLPGNKDEPDGDAVLKAIEAQHGILVERAHRIYAFLHLTLQEYLTARYMVENFGGGKALKDWLAHSFDTRWHEVFLLVSSLLGNADYFFEEILEIAQKTINSSLGCYRLIEWTSSKAKSSKRPNVGGRAVLLLAAVDLARGALFEKLERTKDKTTHDLQSTILGLQSAIDIALDLAIQLDPQKAKLRGRLTPLIANKFDAEVVVGRRIALGICRSLDVRLDSEDMDTYWYSLHSVDIQALQKYLITCRLIVECLEVAVVSDREGITSRLILP